MDILEPSKDRYSKTAEEVKALEPALRAMIQTGELLDSLDKAGMTIMNVRFFCWASEPGLFSHEVFMTAENFSIVSETVTESLESQQE